ncbi:MAG TPA: hypothetical protein VD793_07685 [Gemmatimonadales bacterium]|nr:hypothetical protein [Gemmatimonadales bacterium]
MSRTTRWLVAAGVIGFGGYVVYGSMARVERACELCVDFQGRTECRRGAGATDREAMDAAQTAACGVMAAGMDQSIACQNTRPRAVQCSGN